MDIRPSDKPDREEFNIVDFNIDFIDFLPVAPQEAAFYLPLKCPSSTLWTQVPLVAAAGVTALVGVFVGLFGILVGLAVGVLVGWIIFKRKPGQSKTSVPQQLGEDL